MRKLYCIGEALIDFIGLQKGEELKNTITFEKVAGGAPANVAVAVARLGRQSSLITKLGNDAFGDHLLDILKENRVETDKIFRTGEANTGLAFVSVKENGERDFSFYRNPSADLLYSPLELQENWFNKDDILHFCSVDLVESPMKEAHTKAIESIKLKGGIVSFDPNVRLPLWDDPLKCKQTICEFIPKAHIIKISDEELEFITGYKDVQMGIDSLFVGDVKVVVLTKGSNGADLYLKDKVYTSSGFSVQVQDTTGAGDAFIAGFLYQIMDLEITINNLEEKVEEHNNKILQFANASGAITASGKGAIPSLPKIHQVKHLIDNISS